MARGEDVRPCAPRSLRERDHQPRLQSRATPSALGDRAPACGPDRPRAERHRNSVCNRCRLMGPRLGVTTGRLSAAGAISSQRLQFGQSERRTTRNHDHDFGYHFHSDADKRYGVRYHAVAFGRGASHWDDARCRTQEECAQPGSWADSVRSKLRRKRFNGRITNKSMGSSTSK
jgi:hypothetical protein